MALSDEQNAMLRLLASGEQGYGDIAALLGLSEDEVRAKVVGALAQLQAEGKPAPDVPPPIPGGAKPAAEAVAPEPAAPADEPAGEPVIAEPTAPAGSQAQAPEPAEPQKAATPSTPPPDRPPSGGRTITLPTGQRAWLLGGGILAAIVVIVVVVLLVSGGGGSSTTATEAGGNNATAESGNSENTGNEKPATQARLTAVDGSEAVGLATFGRIKDKLALQIEATGLKPTTEGTDSYTIWLAQTPQKMLPLASTGVSAKGKAANAIAAEFEVPVEILAYLANGTFDQIAITRTGNKAFAASVKAAKKNKTTPRYTGEEVLRGTITGPIVGLAKREEEKAE